MIDVDDPMEPFRIELEESGDDTRKPSRSPRVGAQQENAGPFNIHLDLYFPDAETFHDMQQRGSEHHEVVDGLYGLASDVVKIHWFEPALAVKVAVPRLVRAARQGDTDVAGGQQYAPLLSYARLTRMRTLRCVVSRRRPMCGPHSRIPCRCRRTLARADAIFSISCVTRVARTALDTYRRNKEQVTLVSPNAAERATKGCGGRVVGGAVGHARWATALCRTFHSRLDELGIDFSIVYRVADSVLEHPTSTTGAPRCGRPTR